MVIQRHGIEIDTDALAELCKRYFVRELSLFGSVLRDDFRHDSDVDVLVEFESGAPIGLFELSDLKFELQELLGRKVDLVSKRGLKAVIRDEVLASSEVVYAVWPHLPDRHRGCCSSVSILLSLESMKTSFLTIS